MLDGGQRSQSSDLDATSLLANSFEFRDVADVEHVLGFEQLLSHGRDQVCTTSDNSDGAHWRVARGHTPIAVLCKERDCVV